MFFTTQEPLTGADTDSESDVYEHSAGQTELVHPGGSGTVTYGGASTDGSTVFLYTRDALVPEDVDKTNDAYVARVPVPAGTPGPGQGPGTGQGPGAGADKTAPVITRATLTRGRFRFKLSEPARVRISIARRAKGKQVRSFATVGAITARAGRGSNRVRFGGRVKGRLLSPGRYLAKLTATDAAGNRSRPVTVTFTVSR